MIHFVYPVHKSRITFPVVQLRVIVTSMKRQRQARTHRTPPGPDDLFIVDPREVAKSGFQAYRTDPEILLACMIVSGTVNTARICRTSIRLANELAPATAEEAQRYEAFLRVWSDPTDEETTAVLQWARRIAANPQKPFAWQKGQLH